MLYDTESINSLLVHQRLSTEALSVWKHMHFFICLKFTEHYPYLSKNIKAVLTLTQIIKQHNTFELNTTNVLRSILFPNTLSLKKHRALTLKPRLHSFQLNLARRLAHVAKFL